MADAGKDTGKKKMGPLKIGCLGIIGVFIGLTVIGAIVGPPDKTSAQGGSAGSAPAVAAAAPSSPSAPVEAEQTPSLTGPQQNAARSAKQYISMTGFSRDGLIRQLSSSAGDGYDVADATAAVDSLGIDWKEQAVRSAKQYLQMTGFSCKGLIRQLSSSAGDKYTEDQATYGAKQAGAC